jgi:hypothetical protein
MNRPLTKKEWKSSVTKMWESAIESTYRDLIEKAVLAEREACAKVCEENANDLSEGDWDSACNNCADHIRARGQA